MSCVSVASNVVFILSSGIFLHARFVCVNFDFLKKKKNSAKILSYVLSLGCTLKCCALG